MNITAFPQRVLRIEYAAMRLPLQAIERQVVAKYLSEDAPARLGYERFLGALDGFAGNALGDEEARRRGAALVERSEGLARAAKLDAKAAEMRTRADEDLQEDLGRAAAAREEAQRKEQARLADARRQEELEKRKAEEAANRRTALRKQNADKDAQAATANAEARKQAERQRINATEKIATEPEITKLQTASEKKAEARQKRDEAERLSQLATKERDARRSGD